MNSNRIIGDGGGIGNTSWDFKKGGVGVDDDISDSNSSIGSISEDSMNCVSSSSSSEFAEEADSSASSSSSTQTNGPLYELSQLMNHLPIKRGLSLFYEGKAQSFTSLTRVESIEDLPKKTTPYRKKMKSSKSYAGDLDSHSKTSHNPKAIISKKSSRGSLVSHLSKRGSFLGGSRLSIAVQKNF